MEALLEFLEELIKRHKGDKSAEDHFAFQQLGETDQERVSEVLNKVGINYAIGQNWIPSDFIINHEQDDVQKNPAYIQEKFSVQGRSQSLRMTADEK